MKAILRQVRISPKKVNLVAGMVRGKPAEWAIDFLRYVPKHSARPLMETIKSAVANAEQNFKQKRKDLFISKIIVNEGATLKRFRPVSRGRAHPILKKTTHITVEVAVRAGTDMPKQTKSPKKAAADTMASMQESATAKPAKTTRKTTTKKSTKTESNS